MFKGLTLANIEARAGFGIPNPARAAFRLRPYGIAVMVVNAALHLESAR